MTMKLNLLLLLIIGTFFISCNNKSSDQSKEGSKSSSKEESYKNNTADSRPAPDCYRYIGAKDSIYLQLSDVYGTMTGLLLFKYYQKEEILGTLKGKMTGDVLIADYSFRSDDRMASRQVAFKKQGNDLIEGYGDEAEVNGVTVFKDIKMLKYDETRVLKKVPCSR